MSHPNLRIVQIAGAADPRGSSFTVPISALDFLGAIRDVHMSDILPGAIRGNHFHERHREVLCIRYFDQWSLHWELKLDSTLRSETFSGSGLVLVEVDPLVPHAVRNDGRTAIHVVGLSNLEFDPPNPDSHPFRVA